MLESRRAQLVAYLLAGALVVFAAVRLLGGGGPSASPTVAPLDGPAAELGEPADDARGDGLGDQGAPTSTGANLYVHVAGAVRRPGLYRLPPRARAGMAVERAGGITRRADLASLNLAAAVEDGQQVLVPERGVESTPAPGAAERGAAGTASAPAGASAPATGTAGTAPSVPRVSLSTATAEQLDAVAEGIGPTLAARIVEYRDQNGGFQAVEELREVPGIGEVRLQALRDAVLP